ncbi:MAG: O-antigen ligase family protein [Nitrospinae bacterium]|nr:O-antigen ligase family protein [Nitrospinota bacterium]
MRKLRIYFLDLEERFRRRSPASRMAFGGLLGFAVTAPFSISLAQICVFTALVAWLASMTKAAPLMTQKFPLWMPWLFFALFTLAGAFHVPDSLKSLMKTRELTQIMIFYLTMNVIRDDWEALWLVKALLVATSVAAFYALGVSLPGTLSLANRASGFFSIYMTFGGFLLVVGLLALSYLLVPTRERKSMWVYASALLILTALITTLSRSAWIGLVVGTAVVAVVSRRKKAGLCLALAVVLVISIAPYSIRQRVKSMVNPRDNTAVERINMWQSGIKMFMDRKLLGFGPGRIKDNYARYANLDATPKSPSHLHNNIVHLAAERGVFALGAWIWVWIGYFVLVIQRIRDTRDAPFETRFRMISGLAVAAGFLSAGMFEYNFGDSEVVMLMFVAIALPFIGRTNEVHSG